MDDRSIGGAHRHMASLPSRHEPHGCFNLSKWYVDCTNRSGEAAIGYWAELSWRHLSVRYASVMLFADNLLVERHSLRPGPEPQLEDGLIEWSCKAIDTFGTWIGDTHESEGRLLHRRKQGSLEWRCLQPLAQATVRVMGRLLEGTGYSERIILTLPPWELPIEELRWGRAHFPGHSVVWIDWKGSESMRLVLCDGREVEAAQVSDDVVSTHRGTVRLSDRRVLREGHVTGSSVGAIPGVRQVLSSAGLLLEEHKWLSFATLVESGLSVAGTAIHEVVRWR